MTDLTVLNDDELTAYLDNLEREDAELRARLNDPGALARAARWYASNGIAVFPLRPGGKTPATPKAHPDDDVLQRQCKRACGQDGHGLYDATTDVERVEQWWTRWPTANIGLRTGLRFDVLDIDGPKGMRTYIDQIIHGACTRRDDGVTPACCDNGKTCHGDGGTTLDTLAGPVLGISRTAGQNGGLHLFIHPTGDTIGSEVLPGIDYRGDGGYVVAPPSRGSIGRYSWDRPLDLTAMRAAAA